MKALLIDLYDTIVWTDWQDISHRLSRRLRVDRPALFRGYDETRDSRSTGRHGSVAGDIAAIAQAAGAAVSQIEVDQIAADLVTFLRAHVHLYDDVLPALRHLRAAQVPIALVSNCDHATRYAVDHLGLAREVDEVVLSFEAGAAKPDRAIFEEALSRLRARPEDCLFVDDQTRYVDGAVALGIAGLRMERNPPAEPGPHQEIHNMRPVQDWFLPPG